MKITAISDCHGLLPEIEKSDLLLIAGDTIPLNMQNSYDKSRTWFHDDFCYWLDAIPVDVVLMIAGNHDGYICDCEKEFRNIIQDTKCIYLKDELFELEGIKIYGTPWCHIFGSWWFMDYDDKLSEKFENIPYNVDILLTHDAPYGISDICYGGWNKKEHIGSLPLRDVIIEKSPSKVIHGHLHSTNHDWEVLNNTSVINVSILDEEYKHSYDNLVFEI